MVLIIYKQGEHALSRGAPSYPPPFLPHLPSSHSPSNPYPSAELFDGLSRLRLLARSLSPRTSKFRSQESVTSRSFPRSSLLYATKRERWGWEVGGSGGRRGRRGGREGGRVGRRAVNEDGGWYTFVLRFEAFENGKLNTANRQNGHAKYTQTLLLVGLICQHGERSFERTLSL